MPVLTENGNYVYAIDEHGTPHDEWANVHESVRNIPHATVEELDIVSAPSQLGVINCSDVK